MRSGTVLLEKNLISIIPRRTLAKTIFIKHGSTTATRGPTLRQEGCKFPGDERGPGTTGTNGKPTPQISNVAQAPPNYMDTRFLGDQSYVHPGVRLEAWVLITRLAWQFSQRCGILVLPASGKEKTDTEDGEETRSPQCQRMKTTLWYV